MENNDFQCMSVFHRTEKKTVEKQITYVNMESDVI